MEELVLARVLYVADTPGLGEMLAEADRPVLERQRNNPDGIIAGQGRGYMAEALLGRVANHVVHREEIPNPVVPGTH